MEVADGLAKTLPGLAGVPAGSQSIVAVAPPPSSLKDVKSSISASLKPLHTDDGDAEP